MACEGTKTVKKFKRLIGQRGMTISRLAGLICAGRAHLSQVLNGKPGRGFFTRQKLAPHLKAEELEALGWDEAGGEVFGVGAGASGWRGGQWRPEEIDAGGQRCRRNNPEAEGPKRLHPPKGVKSLNGRLAVMGRPEGRAPGRFAGMMIADLSAVQGQAKAWTTNGGNVST